MWGNAGRLAYIKGQFKRTPTASRLPRQRQGPRHESHDKSRHSQLSHSCDMRPGHGKGLVRLYAPRETNSAHVSTPSENPAPRRRKCRRTCAQSSDHFGCQLPPDSQTPSMSTPGEKRQNQCLDRRPIRTTTDGHVVHIHKSVPATGCPCAHPLGAWAASTPARTGPQPGVPLCVPPT